MQSKTITVALAILFFIYVPLNAAENVHPKTYDVIIVGGGIAGLTAAYYLESYDLLVLEKEQNVGGRATSGQYQGIYYARGPEYLGEPEGPLKEIIATFDLPLLEIPAPADVTFSEGKMFFGEYGKARLIVKRSSLKELNRFAETILAAYEEYEEIPDLVIEQELKRLDSITARQWFEENHFSPFFSALYNVSCRGLFGANIDELSALSIIPEVAFDFEGFEPVNEENTLAEEFADSSNSTGMYSFHRGLAEIPLALGRHIGDRLQTGTKVVGVKREGELFRVTALKANSSTVTYLAESVILATPSAVTLKIAKNILSQEQQGILEGIHYSPYVTIATFSEKPLFNSGFDMAVPDSFIFTDIYDATWISRHYNNKTSNQQSWVTLFYVAPASYRDKTILTMTDDELIKTVLTELDTLLPGSSSLVKSWEITRFQYGYPVMSPGSYQRITRLHAITGKGLFLAGDYMIYPTFEAAASSGQLAAEEVMEWLED